MVNNYRPRTSEAAFSSPTAPPDYPRDWDPYPMYLLKEDIALGGDGALGTVSADRVSDGIQRVSMTALERAKLAGIDFGATATTDLEVHEMLAELLVGGANKGIVFTYDKSRDKLSGVVTGRAAGGHAVDVFQDGIDEDVLLWDSDTPDESDATIIISPTDTSELVWTEEDE